MQKRCIKFWITINVIIILTLLLSGCSSKKNIEAGSIWEVTGITKLSNLTISEGALVKASGNKSLTMTVDGVERAIKPGRYEGKIVLTPTALIFKEESNYGHHMEFNLRTAVYLENGKYVPEKSVSSAVTSGVVADTSVKDVTITSIGGEFNGIIATGDTRASYSITNPKINLTGDGADDFAGVGAAIMADGSADVTVENASIITNGCARTAVFVGGNSTIHVNNSNIETGNPPVPDGYKDVWTEGGKYFFKVPFMLGLSGTCRSTNIVENGKAYYTNTHIKAQGWGALSNDACTGVVLSATKCVIETIESGYGAYALDNSIDTFSGCTFNVADMALIIAAGDAVFTDGTVVNSRRFGVMYHGTGDLTVDKGTVFNTKSTMFQIKGCGSNIAVDSAKLNAGNGIIIQTMPNDDPFVRAGGSGSSFTAAENASAVEGLPSESIAVPVVKNTDVNATFSNMTLEGDIVNGNTASGAVNVSFRKASITGAITTAVVKHALGPNGEEITMKTPELYKLIGEVTNTYCATNDMYGVTVSLDGESRWVVEKTSYLNSLTIAKGAGIIAPEGSSITMTVNGVKKMIRPGEYKGGIMLIVDKGL